MVGSTNRLEETALGEGANLPEKRKEASRLAVYLDRALGCSDNGRELVTKNRACSSGLGCGERGETER